MTIIKGTTKRGQQMIERSKHIDGCYLTDVYKSYSTEKARAYRWCMEQCDDEDGWNFHICSHNQMQFTVAWCTDLGVRIETAKNSYLITEG